MVVSCEFCGGSGFITVERWGDNDNSGLVCPACGGAEESDWYEDFMNGELD